MENYLITGGWPLLGRDSHPSTRKVIDGYMVQVCDARSWKSLPCKRVW